MRIRRGRRGARGARTILRAPGDVKLRSTRRARQCTEIRLALEFERAAQSPRARREPSARSMRRPTPARHHQLQIVAAASPDAQRFARPRYAGRIDVQRAASRTVPPRGAVSASPNAASAGLPGASQASSQVRRPSRRPASRSRLDLGSRSACSAVAAAVALPGRTGPRSAPATGTNVSAADADASSAVTSMIRSPPGQPPRERPRYAPGCRAPRPGSGSAHRARASACARSARAGRRCRRAPPITTRRCGAARPQRAELRRVRAGRRTPGPEKAAIRDDLGQPLEGRARGRGFGPWWSRPAALPSSASGRQPGSARTGVSPSTASPRSPHPSPQPTSASAQTPAVNDGRSAPALSSAVALDDPLAAGVFRLQRIQKAV